MRTHLIATLTLLLGGAGVAQAQAQTVGLEGSDLESSGLKALLRTGADHADAFRRRVMPEYADCTASAPYVSSRRRMMKCPRAMSW